MASSRPFVNPSGDVVWRVQFRVDGKGRQETFRGPGAEKGANEFKTLVDRVGGKAALEVLERRRGNTERVPTFQEWALQYLDVDSGMLTGIEPETRRQYVTIAESSFFDHLGPIPIDVITKADVGQWLAWQERQPSGRHPGQLIAAKTVRNRHALLSSILRTAVEHGLRADNPAHRTRITKGRRREGVFLTIAEIDTLTHFMDPRWRPFVLFLFGTGARWSEATALTWGDLDSVHGMPTVRINKAWKKNTGGSPLLKHPKSSKANRTISLWPELVAQLGERQAGDALLFQSRRGGKVWHGRFMGSVWGPAVDAANDPEKCKAAGLVPIGKRPNIHDARHTHASILIRRGVPLPYVQTRLGHESITTTVNTYGHLQPDAHVQMAQVLAEEMSPILPLEVADDDGLLAVGA